MKKIVADSESHEKMEQSDRKKNEIFLVATVSYRRLKSSIGPSVCENNDKKNLKITLYSLLHNVTDL